MTKKILIFCFQLLLFSSVIIAQEINCDYTILLDQESITNVDLIPGDTVCLQAGIRNGLYIANLKGTAEEPIVLINNGGISHIVSSKSYGLSLANCEYMKILGVGFEEEEYGIKVEAENGNGIKVGYLSSDIETANTEVYNTKYAGIIMKSDPTCDFHSVRDSFTMYNTHIHHNYIHDVGTEGLYIGNSFYLGVNLNACDTVVLPHILDGVDIHHNLIENTGWDGIQLGCALYNSQIHHNEIYYDSQEEYIYQMSGIMVNSGSSANVYNNKIINGKGTGIVMQSTGGQLVYNNLIVNAGLEYEPGNQSNSKQQFGIFCKYKKVEGSDSSYKFINNTIVNPKTDGIRFQNKHSSQNIFKNNIIVNPGAYDFYEENGNLSNIGEDSYIYVYFDEISYLMSHNVLERSSRPVFFNDTINYDYQILASSPAVNNGTNMNYLGIETDLLDVERPFDNYYDIGAYENTNTNVNSIEKESKIIVYPNPFSGRINMWLAQNVEIKKITIYDSFGRIILNNYQTHTKIDFEKEIPNGFYYLEVVLSTKERLRIKIIKN